MLVRDYTNYGLFLSCLLFFLFRLLDIGYFSLDSHLCCCLLDFYLWILLLLDVLLYLCILLLYLCVLLLLMFSFTYNHVLLESWRTLVIQHTPAGL